MFLSKVFTLNKMYLPFIYLVIAWLINYSLGFISFDHDPNSILARDAGAAFTLPLMTSLLWWGKKMCITSGVKNLILVASHRRKKNTRRLSMLFTRIIDKKLWHLQPYLSFLALTISFSYLYSEGLFVVNEASIDVSKYRYILLIQALPFWICILNFITALLLIYRLAHTYLSKYWRVRLFEIEVMGPICNMVVVNFLISILLISVYPLNAIFVTLPATDRYALLFFSLLCSGLLFYPILLVQRAIKKRKEQTLGRINSSLNIQMEQPSNLLVRRRLVDDDTRIQFIADLLVVRKEVHRAPMWPMNMPFAIKMGVILMLPMTSWIGAGIISQLMKSWIS